MVDKGIEGRQNLFPAVVKAAGDFGVPRADYLVERTEVPRDQIFKKGNNGSEFDGGRASVELKSPVFAASGLQDSRKTKCLKDLCQIGGGNRKILRDLFRKRRALF